MPEASVPQSAEREQGTGVTFYGVHTFSDRILFILDVSGSMDQMLEPPSDPEAGMVQFFGKIKIDVARKELIGAINNLEGTDRFNVIFFNHEIVPWQTKVVEGTESNKRRVREWIEEQPPVGFTNIHDALEAGFRFATRVAGRPDVDTIFFLTDGRPTEGKLQDPEAILTAVAEWNRVAGATIHTIGVGDHDKDFMRRLAEMSKGQYVDLGPKDEPEDPDGN